MVGRPRVWMHIGILYFLSENLDLSGHPCAVRQQDISQDKVTERCIICSLNAWFYVVRAIYSSPPSQEYLCPQLRPDAPKQPNATHGKDPQYDMSSTYLLAPFTSPLTIFRSSYSFVNSRLRISRSLTRPLQQLTRASFGVTSPSVWTRSSKVANSGWGTIR